MDIIPAIDIRGGRCVQLVQGDYARETVFGDDPVDMAHRWVAQGARRLHVVDLDGAKDRHPVNDAIVRRIVSEAGVPVQVAGGMSDAAAVAAWAEAGASRIVVGTLAVEDPLALGALVREYGERIAVAIDVRDGKVATRGWLDTSDDSADDFARAMAALGVSHFVYTDISSDGMLRHPDFDAAHHMLEVLAGAGPDVGLIYSGGVTSIEDVIALSSMPLEGAIVGTALYDGRLDLQLALQALITGDGTG